MSNQDKFQPVLGGPTNMGATVAEERQGNSPLAFLNSALKLGANVMSDVTTTTREDNKYLKEAAENQMMNDYATEMSKLKSAYDQKKMSLEDLDIATRKVTDKYYQQNLISAKDLHSIRDGAIGTDVSGKRLETDLGIEKAQKERVINQRNTIIDKAREKNPALALSSDEQVMSYINKVEILSRNLVGAIDTYNQTIQADDKGNLEYAKEGVVKAATDVEVENVFRGIMNGIHLAGSGAVFTPTAYQQNRQILYNRLIDRGVEAGMAMTTVDRVMDITGYKQAVDLIEQGVVTEKEWTTKLNETKEAANKHRVNINIPLAGVLSAFPPETQALVLGNSDLLTTLQNDITKFLNGETVDNTGNVIGTQAYGTLLHGAINGQLQNMPVKRVTTLIQGSINNTSLPENINDLSDDEVKTVEKNAEVTLKTLSDKRLQEKIMKEGSTEDQQTLADSQKKGLKTLAQIYKHSIDNSQWVGNIRYEESTGSVVLIGDEGGTGLFKSLSAPYSANIVEKMNQTLDWIRGSLAFNERQKKQYVKDCLEYWGITELAEGESRTGLGGLTGKQIGKQGVEFVEETSNFLTAPGELFGEAVLASKDPNYRGPIGKDIDTVIENAPELGKAAKGIVTSPGEAVGEAVAEAVINVQDRKYSGKVEQAIDTVYDALPDTVKNFVEAPAKVIGEIQANIKDSSHEGEVEQAVKYLYNKAVPQWLKDVVESPTEAVTEFALMRKDPSYKGDNITQALTTIDRNITQPVAEKAGELSAEASRFIINNFEALKALGKENFNQLIKMLGGVYDKYFDMGDIESEEAFKRAITDSSYEKLALHTLEQQRNKRAKKLIEDLNSRKYNTPLTEQEEKAYQRWAKRTGREQDVIDYDLRGAWKENAKEADNGHLTDKYKKPNHPTFTDESIYYRPGMKAGKWIVENGKDVYIAPRGLSKQEKDKLKKYFKEVEEGSILRFED